MKTKLTKLVTFLFVLIFIMVNFGCGEGVDEERKNLPFEDFDKGGILSSQDTLVVKTMNCADLIKHYEENPKIDVNFLYLQIDGHYRKPEWLNDYAFSNEILAESQADGVILNPRISMRFFVYDSKYGSPKKKSCEQKQGFSVSASFKALARSYPVEDINGEITFEHYRSDNDESNYDYCVKVFCGEQEAMLFCYSLMVNIPMEYFENYLRDNIVRLTKDKEETL